jgi:isoquinoline 1-oxidoreductase beta subunit
MAWIHVRSDDAVVFYLPETEMGQGILTTLAVAMSDELGADWSKVRAEHAPMDDIFGEQETLSSSSIQDGYKVARAVAAYAREILKRAAAERLAVPADECTVEQGAVLHAATGGRVGFGAVAEAAAKLRLEQEPTLKEPWDLAMVGKPIKRLDLSELASGSVEFGMDATTDGMLIGVVARRPHHMSQVQKSDVDAAKAISGVVEVIEIPSGVVVLAESFWAATKGRKALRVEWEDPGIEQMSSESAMEAARARAQQGENVHQIGDVSKLPSSPARRLEASYELPSVAQLPMEPLSCLATVRDDDCEVWASTQSPTAAHILAQSVSGLSPGKVTLHRPYVGGGFGRRSYNDFVADAVEASKAVRKPVKVIWTREDELAAGLGRPFSYSQLFGAVDDEGWPTHWIHRIATPSVYQLNVISPPGGHDPVADGARDLPYAIPNIQVSHAHIGSPNKVWHWRSGARATNAYVTECFLDELARLGGKDPLELRLKLLKDHPRHARALETAAEKAGWGKRLGDGRKLGLAVHETAKTVVAQVAEVSLEASGPRVHRVVCAVDCGDPMNPDLVAAQMEGGIIYGLSAVLYGEISVENGRVKQKGLSDHPVLRMNETPEIEVHHTARGDPVGGVGGAGTPPIGPAVANALLALTGEPVRTLPIRKWLAKRSL